VGQCCSPAKPIVKPLRLYLQPDRKQRSGCFSFSASAVASFKFFDAEARSQDEELTLNAHSSPCLASKAFVPIANIEKLSAFRVKDSTLHPHSDRAPGTELRTPLHLKI
jgi:hypothetical protein